MKNLLEYHPKIYIYHRLYHSQLIISWTLVLGILISICEGIAYIWSGAYGNVEDLGLGNGLIILFQLTFSGIVVLLLDDLLNKGYGIGSGISLFIATNVCENILVT